MKMRFTIPVIAAFASLSPSMLITRQASAHQNVYHSYYYPYTTSAGATYSQGTATCRTGYPDYDSSCVNGDRISLRWWVRTRAQAMVDIEYALPVVENIHDPDDWWCNETLYCADGTTPSFYFRGSPCGWTACAAGVSASKVDVSFGINYSS